MGNFKLILIAITAMVVGLWLAKVTQTPEPQVAVNTPDIQGVIYPAPREILPFKLIDHNGTTFTQEKFKNKWHLIFVGYTHCPDICPTTLALMTTVYEAMQANNQNAPNITFLSVDPDRDTVDKLKQYVEYFNPVFTGLTGDIAEINKLSRNLNAVYMKAPGLSGVITEDDYLIDHSSALMLINPRGQLQSMLTAPHSPMKVIESILKSQEHFKNS